MPYWTTFHRSPLDAEARGDWDNVPEDEVTSVLRALGPLTATTLPTGDGSRVSRHALSFYPDHVLYEFVDLDKQPRQPSYFVVGPEHVEALDGTNMPVRRINNSGRLLLTDETSVDYLLFYIAHVGGSLARYVVLQPDDVSELPGLTREQTGTLNKYVVPLKAEPAEGPETQFVIPVAMIRGANLYAANAVIRKGGQVGLDEQTLLGGGYNFFDDPSSLVASGTPSPFHVEEGWSSLSELDAELRGKLKGLAEIAASDKLAKVSLSFRSLPFFTDVVLVRIADAEMKSGFGIYGLWSPSDLYVLRGRSKDIFEAIERETFGLDDESVRDYLKFFCAFSHGDEGPFRIVTRLADINTTQRPPHHLPLTQEAIPVDFDRVSRTAFNAILRDATVGELNESGSWPARAFVQYATQLVLADFDVLGDGSVTMTNDEVLVDEIPADRSRDKILLPSTIAATITGPDELDAFVRSATRRSNWPSYLNERELELSVMRECVRVQLVDALRRGHGAPLFEAPEDADDENLLVAFAKFLFEAWPVVVAESRITYVERLISDLLVDRVEQSPDFKTVGPSPYNVGEGLIDDISDGDFWQVSMHEWYSIRRPEAVVHQLGTTDSVMVIGCDAVAAIPAPLRRVTDVVIVLDNLDADLFRSTFCQLFDCDWPGDGDDTSQLWQRYVTPSDFYKPVRDMLRYRYDRERWSATAALEEIRARVFARLSPVGAASGPKLGDIHGLGDARQVLTDLLGDIRAAVDGEIPWKSMDRGMLLVGEPGTGKTMLAKALARDCGVRFIQASQAQWMVGSSHLGEHIREIRATFAEARRYAPSILFIDELDSIGNRELFEGKNRQYCIEIVNVLLQELQGVYDRDGVFVIGATNYLGRVDSALVRAGRLDQVVHIPRPNREALADILRFHLRDEQAEGRVDDDVDCHALAALAIGSTGADIELFVRDATRRARKDGSARIGHRHLASAITRSPRDAESLRPFDADQQARTAVHEAGHAIAMLLCEHYPARLNMVSIIPRADGSLGFTGFVPDERSVLTRRDLQEYLRVLLAGRAAEELEYGADTVSSGAGGASNRNDLALATQLASRLVCQLGMGDGAALRWQAEASDPDDITAMSRLLSGAYDEIVTMLAAHRGVLAALRDRLLDSHEIFAADVYALADEHDVTHRGGLHAAGTIDA